MPKKIIIEDNTIINSNDWEGKSKKIIEALDKELFENIDIDDAYAYKFDKDGNVTSKTKRNVKRNEILPTISPAQVTIKLNRLLRIYKPMNVAEAMTLKDTDYLEAYGYYLDIIFHINKYTTFLGDKQTYSAFVNISTDTYNELLTDQRYCQVFASIEDGFVQSNFSVAQAGLVDNKTTIAKLETKGAGHSLIKSPEALIINYNKTDKALINEKLNKFLGMIQPPKNK